MNVGISAGEMEGNDTTTTMHFLESEDWLFIF